MLRPPATGDQSRAFFDPLLDVALDAVPLAPHGERTHAGPRVERVAYRDRREGGGECFYQLVVTVQRHDDAGQRCADLAGEDALRVGTSVAAVDAMSASSKTTAALLPPSSRVKRAIRSPHSEAMRRPAAVEPVKEILSTRGSVTSSSDTARSAVTRLSTPGGRPTSRATSARMYASPGASGDAFRMMVQPASSARGLVALAAAAARSTG